jgi:hypothetical protein
MNRNGGVIALTVVGVLVAGGAAAALNTAVLHGSTQASVGSAEQLLSSGLSPLDPSVSASTASVDPTPVSVASEDSAEESDSPETSSSHAATTSARSAATPRATRTSTRRATVARVSSPRPSPTPTEDHGGSHNSKSTSASPTSGSGSSGGGSDD